MSFALTMLSWSTIEYEHKYRAIGEYEHVRELIKWGTDYLLLTFDSSAAKIDKIYSQVGGSLNGSSIADDHNCWQRPEDMEYTRRTQTAISGPDLAGEMTASLASASIVFRDNVAYSKRLLKGAQTLFDFARDNSKKTTYSSGNPYTEAYNSTGYYDEHVWGAAWLYLARGKNDYLSLATDPGIADKAAQAFVLTPDSTALSWDNKMPAAMLLLTRIRVCLSRGYPYEEMLKAYHNITGLTMCAFLKRYQFFNWTRGGMIQVNNGKAQPLQYVANAAFLASVFSDYMDISNIPQWQCGPDFIPISILKDVATSQMNYILGANPMNMSYVVGHGDKFLKHVHHRGASIPNDKHKYSCTGGWRWRDSPNPNPNTITGAMVAGPDQHDHFKDVRTDQSYTDPTLAGNAGLVAALVSLTTSGRVGVDKDTIFTFVRPYLYPQAPPLPPPWKP